jgi:uncharacterized SAM-binding protein YcdF (DUF218 family)
MRARWLRLRKALVHGLATIGFVVVMVTATPFVIWWGRLLGGDWTDRGGRTLIVLAGDSMGGGIIGERSYLRARYAVLAYKRYGYNTVLITGDVETTQEMGSFLKENGVPPERIVLEQESHSTHESAIHTATYLFAEQGADSASLLTSDFHMYRARRSFARAGVTVQTRPIPDCGKRGQRWHGRWSAFQDLMVESVKIGYYGIRGWI